MNNCPSAYELTLYVENKSSSDESEKIRAHIASCQECLQVYQSLLEILVLDSEGNLHEITKKEKESVKRCLFHEKQTGESKKAAGNTISPENSEDKNSFQDGLLGGTLLAGTFSFINEIFHSLQTTPALGSEAEKLNENSSQNTVRNDDLSSSISSEQQTNEHNYFSEEQTMDMNIQDHNIEKAPTEIGLPSADGQSEDIQQGYDDTCAIRSQELILRDFGIPVTEDTLRQQAMDKGWYSPGSGTYLENVGNLLEMYGVETHRYEEANIFNLTSELAQGHKVIVAVDADELWYKSFYTELSDALGLPGSGHALLVSGIDTSDPDNVKVILTDPGSGDIAKAYPLEQFIDAWSDNNCFMVATDEAAPHFNHEMSNFDYETGHLENIGEVSWQELERASILFHDIPVNSQITDHFTHAVAGENDPAQFSELLDELQHESQETAHSESSGHTDHDLNLHHDQDTDHHNHEAWDDLDNDQDDDDDDDLSDNLNHDQMDYPDLTDYDHYHNDQLSPDHHYDHDNGYDDHHSDDLDDDNSTDDHSFFL